MKPLLFACLMMLASTGCSVVSHYAGAYGQKAQKGEVIRATSFSYTVPLPFLRVQADDNGLVAYEDYGPGLGRGRVFVVRPGSSRKKEGVLDDLREFGRSPARVLQDGRLVAVRSGDWKGVPAEFHLIEVPQISRRVGAKSKTVDRERVWILGMTVSVANQRYWISLTSGDQFISEAEAIGGRNLQSLFEFADGFGEKANKAPEPTPRPVTIPAEPGIAPVRVVAHL